MKFGHLIEVVLLKDLAENVAAKLVPDHLFFLKKRSFILG